MAAATPIAGAPRTTMLRMTSATCSCVLQVHINFFRRQLRLIDEAHALVCPFESLNHNFL